MARDDPRCLPSSGTLPRFRWLFRARSPATTPSLSRCDDCWTTLSRHPGSTSILHQFHSAQPDARRSVRTTHSPMLSLRCVPRLDPRSHPPPPFSRALRRCLFEARCRLPISATAYDVRANKPELPFPRRDEGLDLLPFRTHHAGSSRISSMSGDTRRATHVLRSMGPRCRFLSLPRVCPTAIPHRPRHESYARALARADD